MERSVLLSILINNIIYEFFVIHIKSLLCVEVLFLYYIENCDNFRLYFSKNLICILPINFLVNIVCLYYF